MKSVLVSAKHLRYLLASLSAVVFAGVSAQTL